MTIKKKLAYPYEYFKNVEDYEKPIEVFMKCGKETYFNNFHYNKVYKTLYYTSD